MKFSKIKWDGACVELQWTSKLDGAGEITHALKSYDTPRPEFVEAMRAVLAAMRTRIDHGRAA